MFLLDELKRKGGISHRMYEQYNDFLAEIVPSTGSGISGEQQTDKLIVTLREWLEELVEKGSSALKNKIGAILNELLRRKRITNKRYDEIKQEHSIF